MFNVFLIVVTAVTTGSGITGGADEFTLTVNSRQAAIDNDFNIAHIFVYMNFLNI
jgi:hypothetical protein